MAEFRIEMGASEEFRHIGVQPPLSPALIQMLEFELDVEIDGADFGITPQFDTQNEPYTQLTISTERGNGDVNMLVGARAIARMLEEDGHTPLVDNTMHDLTVGNRLFG